MTTINFQCNVCQRFIQLQENPQGLTVFGKCIITEGCLGQLNTVSRNIDSNRDVYPDSVEGLLDYFPRKAFFQYTQSILATTWNINHDLSTSPAVVVYVNTIENAPLVQLNPNKFTITILTKDTLTITLQQPYMGIAQCIARSTTVTANLPPIASTQVQVTVNGIMTLAVQEYIANIPPLSTVVMDNAPFSLLVNVKQPSQTLTTTAENVLPTINSESTWSDWPKILVRKRKNYLVRTLNVLNLGAFNGTSVNNIQNGTQVSFSDVLFPFSSFRAINSREILVLLTNAPYTNIDKVKGKIIDLGDMINSPINYFTFTNGDLFVDSSLIDISFPSTSQVI